MATIPDRPTALPLKEMTTAVLQETVKLSKLRGIQLVDHRDRPDEQTRIVSVQVRPKQPIKAENGPLPTRYIRKIAREFTKHLRAHPIDVCYELPTYLPGVASVARATDAKAGLSVRGVIQYNIVRDEFYALFDMLVAPAKTETA